MVASYRLVMHSGPLAGRAFPMEKTELFVGRDLSNDIVINDPEVSRRHARLFLQGNNFVLEDLGSTNGTAVNGQRLLGPYILHPGETVVFGEHITAVFEATQPDVGSTVVSALQQAPRSAPAASPGPAYAPPPYVEPAGLCRACAWCGRRRTATRTKGASLGPGARRSFAVGVCVHRISGHCGCNIFLVLVVRLVVQHVFTRVVPIRHD
jgi:hypothetical protein